MPELISRRVRRSSDVDDVCPDADQSEERMLPAAQWRLGSGLLHRISSHSVIVSFSLFRALGDTHGVSAAVAITLFDPTLFELAYAYDHRRRHDAAVWSLFGIKRRSVGADRKKDLHSVGRHGEFWKSCSLYRPIAALSQFLHVLVTSKSSVCVATQAEVGAPGVVVGVSVDGAKVWSEGWCLKLAAVHLCLDCYSTSAG